MLFGLNRVEKEITDQPKSDSFAALRYKDFRLYFGMRFLFTVAYQMQTTVIGFYVYQLTHSKVAIAFIGISEVIPALAIALYGGYIADKCEKRKMLLLIYSGVLLTSFIMFAATFKGIAGNPSINLIVAVIYSMLFFNGVARAFYEPATFTVYAHSVPKEIYPNASTWNNLSWQSAYIIGPLAGGFIYAFAGKVFTGVSGITATFIAVMFVLFLSSILVYKLKKYPVEIMKKERMRDSLMTGIKFVFHNKIMLYTMSLDMFSVFFGGVTALLPIYALDILKTGAEGLGIMRMMASLGAALTMMLLVKFSPMNRPWRNLLIAITGFGFSIIGFGLSHSILLSLVFLFAQGAFDSVSVVIRGTIMQLLTPDNMRGRVSAINSMFIGSSAEIGDFESGMMAKLMGTVPAVLFGGSVTLMVVLFTYFRTKKLIPIKLDKIRNDAGVY